MNEPFTFSPLNSPDVSSTQTSLGMFSVTYHQFGNYEFTCTVTDNHDLTGTSSSTTVNVRKRK